MTDDLTHALREGGHDDLAAALERKQLAGQLRESGRDDLADQLEAPPPAQPGPAKSPELRTAEQMRDALNSSLTKWHSLGGNG